MPGLVMSFDETSATSDLRQRIRELVDEDLPPTFRGAFVEGTSGQEIANAFCRTLADHGLLTISWPAEFGGSDASIFEQAIIREELWAAHEPRGAQYMGLNWVGPAIMQFGTPAQKEHHLRAIATGDAIWCQGFSEPNSGSDLASLQLDAARTEEGWRLNGQKIWTSYAQLANWCFLAARTARLDRKQQGITIFLIPMSRSGITVRPIESIMGPHHINEVFFDDVLVDEGDVLGDVDRGWDVIQSVLANERIGIARYARCDRILSELWDVLQEDIPEREALLREHAKALVRTRAARLLSYRSISASDEELGLPGGPNVARIAATHLDQHVAELAMEVLGPTAVIDAEGTHLDGSAESAWRYSRSATISSGTTEIQRLLIARDVEQEVERRAKK